MAKKWTIEWAMSRWAINKIENGNNTIHYTLGWKAIFIGLITAQWTKGSVASGELKSTLSGVFHSERDAVRWLVSGHPRLKKKKWALKSTEKYTGAVADNVSFRIIGDNVVSKTVLIRKGKILTAKNYLLSEPEAAE